MNLIEILSRNDCSQFFLDLKNHGALKAVFPELDALSGVKAIGENTHKENFLHTLEVLKNACDFGDNFGNGDKISFRLVALTHDLGKARTKKYLPGKGWTFYNHELESSRMLKAIFKRYDIEDDRLEYVAKLVEWHGITQELTSAEVTDSAIRRFYKAMGNELDDMINFCKCDTTTKNAHKKQKYHGQLDELLKRCIALKAADIAAEYRPPIDGKDVMDIFHLPPGKEVGEIKKRVEEAIKANLIADSREEAIELLFDYYWEHLSKKYDAYAWDEKIYDYFKTWVNDASLYKPPVNASSIEIKDALKKSGHFQKFLNSPYTHV